MLGEFTVVKTSEKKLDGIVIVGSDTKKRIRLANRKNYWHVPGKDGCTRMVKLKTKDGGIVRPVKLLFPLELDNDDRIIFSVTDPVPSDKDIKILKIVTVKSRVAFNLPCALGT
ncbi:hypothetical protein TNIN_308511 [Trichonephila inaurata madagascariensis]|uniref:DUF5641 domain-containing protein n=1 Tax=Trichonephila inaurata madagascariensis TaxID=2747483 RepID=A0A8X6M888_9ARAC|nr:hypothetical protein TNIN_308511 [Trichonephila inaurata madagascariensis]